MRGRAAIALLVVLGLGAMAAYGMAWTITSHVERVTRDSLVRTLSAGGHDWLAVETDGLRVALAGQAPNKASRDAAMELVSRVIEADRTIDRVTVAPPLPASAPDAPKLRIIALRDGNQVRLTGLVPAADTRLRLAQALAGLQVIDTLERVAVEVDLPDDWGWSRDAALQAVAALNRGRVEAYPCQVAVAGTMSDIASRDALERAISGHAHCRTDIAVVLPRPLVSPYRFELRHSDAGMRLTACAAPDAEGLARIEMALNDTGLTRPFACTEALGAPSADWTDAVLAAIGTLKQLERGRIAISDTEVVLDAAESPTGMSLADGRIALSSALPRGFLLRDEAVAGTDTEPASAVTSAPRPPADFVASTVTGTDGVSLIGTLRTEAATKAVASYAAAYFGLSGLDEAIGVEPDLPDDWTARVMAGIDALALLDEGEVTVAETRIRLVGWTSDPTAKAAVRSILSRVARNDLALEIEIAFDETAPATEEAAAPLPPPETCLTEIQALLAEGQISFPSSSTVIQAASYPLLDDIATILKGCTPARFEIGGHTDNSGRAEKNMELSKGRAEAVVDALLARGVFLERMIAKGYGETEPIADNETEAGRALNRRIGIKLLGLLEVPDDIE